PPGPLRVGSRSAAGVGSPLASAPVAVGPPPIAWRGSATPAATTPSSGRPPVPTGPWPARVRPPRAARPRVPFFWQHLFEGFIRQQRFGQQLLELGVLDFEALEAFGFIFVQPTVLLPPAV